MLRQFLRGKYEMLASALGLPQACFSDSDLHPSLTALRMQLFPASGPLHVLFLLPGTLWLLPAPHLLGCGFLTISATSSPPGDLR